MTELTFNRTALDNVLTRRFFFAPAFEIYGGQAGLYDYGPPGCALQANFIDLWRRHFVMEEDMLEIDSTILTPFDVLKTSGHVDKFSDWMVKDMKTGDIFRADHLLENVISARLEGDVRARQSVQQQAEAAKASADAAVLVVKEKKSKQKAKVVAVKLTDSVKEEYENMLAQIDNYSGPELGVLIRKHDVRTPETNNEVSDPVEFNLMFDTIVGPSGNVKSYLRPETAQGQFVNFSRLLEFNNGRMPFASAQIGRSFRNEISPRNGLLRVREFLMGEIEHYVDPLDKNHPSFDSVRHVVLNLLPASVQLNGRTDIVPMSVGEAVAQSVIDNETLGYFLARVHLFLIKIGVNVNLLRFRQHMNNEMAHYACDCWDAELKTSFGWIECVGCADRSAFDLSRHTERTGHKLVVRQALAEPLIVTKLQVIIDKKVFGPTFKKNAKVIEDALMALTEQELQVAKTQMDGSGKINVTGVDRVSYEVAKQMATIEQVTIKEHVREYIPNVIEPSFGVGRILYSMLEHVFYTRENDEERGVLAFPPCMAPIKCLLVPLSNHESFSPIVKSLSARLRKMDITTRVDDSASSIGRRYARNDELGTPFAITVDFQTVKDNTATLRERDSTSQIRESTEIVLELLKQLVRQSVTWSEVVQKYPTFTQQDA